MIKSYLKLYPGGQLRSKVSRSNSSKDILLQFYLKWTSSQTLFLHFVLIFPNYTFGLITPPPFMAHWVRHLQFDKKLKQRKIQSKGRFQIADYCKVQSYIQIFALTWREVAKVSHLIRLRFCSYSIPFLRKMMTIYDALRNLVAFI